MRIRKSVPEGYKTGTSYGGFELFAEERKPMPVSSPMRRSVNGERTTRGSYNVPARELTPFCGILKVGGMAVQAQQPYGYGDGYEGYEEEEGILGEEEVPFLSSQGSTISSSSAELNYAVSASNKRRFADEEEELEESATANPILVTLQDGRIWHDETDMSLSPKSKPVDSGFSPFAPLGLRRRALATPRSRIKGKANRDSGFGVSMGLGSKYGWTGQENNMEVDVDFEEAEFLDRRNGVAVGDGDEGWQEVVMRDV
jgi:hypothetical protein